MYHKGNRQNGEQGKDSKNEWIPIHSAFVPL
jgi:hypothetical protein